MTTGKRRANWQAKLDEHAERIGSELDLACTRIEVLEQRADDDNPSRILEYVSAVTLAISIVALIVAVLK